MDQKRNSWLVYHPSFGSLELMEVETGVTNISTPSHVCCATREHTASVQPDEVSGKFAAAYCGTARCTRVRHSWLEGDPNIELLRFSKLFMSHLDSEFRKQPRTELQSLLSDQVPCLLYIDTKILMVVV